jgi:hypothetical protein
VSLAFSIRPLFEILDHRAPEGFLFLHLVLAVNP